MMFTIDKQEAYFHQAAAYYNAARVLFIPDRDREFNSIYVFGPLTFCIGHALELTLKLHLMLKKIDFKFTHDLKKLFKICIEKKCFSLLELDERCSQLNPIQNRPVWLLAKAKEHNVFETKDGTIFNTYTQVVSLSQNFFQSLAGDASGKSYLVRYPEIDFPHHKFDIEVVLTAIDILLDAARCKIIEHGK